MGQKAKVIIIGGEKTDVSGKLEQLCGIEADYAATGIAAAEALAVQNYDMAFLNLTADDAVAALFSVRETNYRCTYMPVIALALPRDSGFFTEQGVNGVLIKPVDENELAALLRKWLPDEKIGTLASGSPVLGDKLKAAADLCGVNVRLALARLNGMQRVVEITMRAVGASIPARNQKMADAIEKDKIDEFLIEIHGIKSSLASIGEVELADVAAALEAGAKSGDMGYCAENFPDFSAKAEKLGEKLRSIFC